MSPTRPHPVAPPGRSRAGGRQALVRRAVLLTVVVLAFVLAGSVAAFAATTPPAPVAPDLNTVLNNVRNWIMGILALLATVFLSIGGVRYLISNGEPSEVGKAKDSFRNAAWGYGLAALAPVVVGILKQIVGG
ncbi:pilin [Frankia sp. R82]|uniref:pilin n=1 Tax=Frankia sp. R82 TaxID=2950553 RepID=UPI0020435594|nr:pilin [Frankia sp. R82]MCM3885829.1 pilin [Frankia sp. R82]